MDNNDEWDDFKEGAWADESPVTKKKLDFKDDIPAKRKPESQDLDLIDITDSRGKRKKGPENNLSGRYSDYPLEGESFTFTDPITGRRLYVGVQPESSYKLVLKQHSKQKLLSTPISFLLDRIQQEEYLSHRKEPKERNLSVADSVVATELWVDKYSPKKFTDLLTDEQLNRKILHWLKSWEDNQETAPAKQSKNKYERIPPNYKIILLTGPPGLGKTTLAHVIARHAGFNAVEINASDDRSTELFKSKVLNAIEMQAIWIGNNKPNCLVIDEIDGITDSEGKGAVDFLVNLVNGTIKTSKKKGGDTIKLTRPIICICNNQYVPVLRKLRNIAYVCSFDRPTVPKLSQRLKEICNKEGLSIDTHTLSAICELTECDIRSCLHTLQFLKRKTNYVTPEMITTMSIGHKDLTKNLFEMWKEIFQAPTVKNKTLARIINQKTQEESALSDVLGRPAPRIKSYFDNLMCTVEEQNDYDKIIEGCYENYLSMQFNDPTMTKVSSCLDWMAYTDQIEREIKRDQKFQLIKYQVATPLAFHKLCSSTTTPSLQFPKAASEYKIKLEQYRDTMHTFLVGATAPIYRNLSTKIVSLDYISHLLDLLTPNIRPVAIQLLNQKEKLDLASLASALVSYGLSYIKKEDGSSLQLKPAIEQLAQFSTVDYNKRHKTLPSVLLQTIEIEVHRENSRRAVEIASSMKVDLTIDKDTGDSSTTKVEKKPPTELKELYKTHQEKEVKDFFGRPITKPKQQQHVALSPEKKEQITAFAQQVAANGVVGQTPAAFKFKFHEGTTDAVKRVVMMRSLLD